MYLFNHGNGRCPPSVPVPGGWFPPSRLTDPTTTTTTTGDMKVVQRIERWVARGQDKIGAYDKQLWEKSVEERVLKSIAQVPKKNARVKAELIDVDLVRGSTFTKAKPQHGWLAVSRMGLLRLLLLPIFLRWWESQTTRWFTVLILVLYLMQVGTTATYMTDTTNIINNQSVSLTHLTSPWVLMLVLGLMHAQIVATRLSHKHHHLPKRKRRHGKNEKRKRKIRTRLTASERESASQETGPDTHLEEDSSSSRERRSQKLSASKRSDRLKNGSRRKNSPRKDSFPDRAKEVLSTASDKGVNTEERTFCNGLSQQQQPQQQAVFISKSMLNCSQRSDVSSIPKITCCDDVSGDTGYPESSRSKDGISPSYKGFDDNDSVTGCSSEQGVLNEPISDFTGQLILPNENSEQIQLTDDLIIPCDCAAPDLQTKKRPVEFVTSSSDLQSSRKEASSLNSLTRDALYHNSLNSIKDTQNPGEMTRASHIPVSKVTPRVMCCDEGISVDLPPKSEDKSPTEDFSISSTGSDSLLFDTKKPREASTLMRVSEKSAFHPPIIVRTDGDGGATNEETDSELSFPIREPDMMLRRRRRVGSTGSPFDSKKVSIKRTMTNNDRLSVKVADMKESPAVSSCESEQETTPNTPISLRSKQHIERRQSSVSSEGQTSEYEWDDTMHSDVTSSDTSSCSTDSESSDRDDHSEDPFHTTHVHNSSSVLNNLASNSDKVSCMIWEEDQVKKVDLSVLDIGWTIIQKVDKIPQMCDYVVLGVLFAMSFTLMPVMFRAYNMRSLWPVNMTSVHEAATLCNVIFGAHWRIQVLIINGAVQRFILALIFFFLLSVADRTFKQRLLYAKNFCYLTSSRRARKYELPHFRLNKVRNIKTWLSLRSYLKKRGPQRSIDTIVSAAFILAVVFVSLMCLKLLQDSGGFLDHLGNWELVGWCMALAIYLLRFMTIGTKINRKYRNFSVLITEQINLYLHMEQKPHKKDELMLANSVLKLAEDLLKELESPFKISGLSANPFLYNVTKVIVLSAFSAVLTELLGFKLKLYKIKIRP